MPPEDRVGLTASRLRLVQVQCADQGDDVRRQNLEEEVDRAMKTLSPDDRRGFLTRLLDEFPAWQAEKVEAAAAPPAATFDKSQLQDPAFLLDKMKELAPHLTPEERAGVAQELDAAGYPMAGKPAWPPAASVELRQLLGMLPHETFDATRLLEILSMLIEFSLNVEQLAWATWREIDGANTSVKKQVDLKIAIRKSITGDGNTPRPVVKPGPERVQRLLSGIINNVPPVAKWAMAHFKNLSPQNLTRKLQLEGRLPMMFPQRAQWAEYEEQFAQLNEEAMKATILRNIADGVRAKLGT